MGQQPSKTEEDGGVGDGESSPLLCASAQFSGGDRTKTPSSSGRQSAEDQHGGGHPILEYPSALDNQGEDEAVLDQTAKSEDDLRDAACLVRDAVLGDSADDDPSEGSYCAPSAKDDTPLSIRDRIAAICRRILVLPPLVNLPLLVGAILICLTFLEPPQWCRSLPGGCHTLLDRKGVPFGSSSMDEDKANRDVWVQYYPNTRSVLLTIDDSRALELICLVALLLWIAIRVGRDGSDLSVYLRPGPARSNRVLQLMCMALLLVGLLVQSAPQQPYVRAVLVVTLLPNVQRDLRVLWHMLPQTGNILSLLLILVVFYAFLGTIAFVDTQEGRMHFPSLVEALWTLYICVTTANYPDVMMPAYNANRWTALYFVSFMVVSYFYFMNVILAAIVQEYEAAVEQRRADRQQRAADLLEKAFMLLHDPRTTRVDRSTLMALLDVLRDDMGDATFRDSLSSKEQRKLVFALLDRDGTESITYDEFMNLGLVLQLELVQSSAYQTVVERHMPEVHQSLHFQRLNDIIRSPRFDTFVDCVLVMNALVIAIQSYPELSGQRVSEQGSSTNSTSDLYQNGQIDTAWEVVEAVFTALYVLECGLKVTVFGSRAYFERGKNVFDCAITGLAVVCSVLVYLPNEINDSRIIRMVVMARVLRLLRVLTSRKRFQLIGAISAEILPQAMSVLLILFFLLYMFAVIGTHLYGGMITRDPHNPLSPLLMGTDFSDSDYWGNNFNDMLSAMNVLFNLLVINNWTVCESGFEAATQGKWVRWYFVCFHVLGVILVNNLVIAFVINNFMQQFSLLKEAQQSESTLIIGNAVIDVLNRQVNFDASQVTGTETGLTGGYIARYRRSGSSRFSDCERRDTDRLRRLFTQTKS
jgi:Ion transport protein